MLSSTREHEPRQPLSGSTCGLVGAAILCLASLVADAQPWSGILASSRATDWTTAGVVGGIPSGSWPNCTTAACNTLYGGSVTAATIQNALASAPAASVVRIPAGTFSLTSGITFSRSDVVLRGAGSTATRLDIGGTVTGGGLGLPRAISFLSGATGVGGFGGIQAANWTAGYAQNATVITLSNSSGVTAGPVGTGTLLFLDQANDAADGWPAAGDLYVCESGTPCSNQAGTTTPAPDEPRCRP